MSGLINATLSLASMGLIFGVGLAYASKKFAVEKDEKEIKVLEVLPGANCGACGYPGCGGYAKAVAEGDEINKCSVGGAKVVELISSIMGVEASSGPQMVAKVRCKGGTCAKDQFEYSGIQTCAAENIVFGGRKACKYGCLGGGDCVAVCEFDALKINEFGVAEVNPENCVACKKCIAECPKGLIEMVPKKQKTIVECMNVLKGPSVKQNCENACIACKMCERTCKFDAIHVINNVAVIDYEKCVDCTACARKCPTGAIRLVQKAKKVKKEELKEKEAS